MPRGLLPVIAIALSIATPRQESPPQSNATPAQPIIQLDKTRFAASEEVFFWVGVTAPDDYLIPNRLWDSCQLTITRPDGTVRVDKVGWPIDGMLERGWRGGHRLNREPIQLGRYTLVFEFAGQKTQPYSLDVEFPILKEIATEFVFPSPLVFGEADASVTLTVRNRSNQVIRFPHRGEHRESVSVSLLKTTGEKWSSSFFVPDAVLLSAAGVRRSRLSEDKFSWALASQVPTVTLQSGETYRLRLPLAAVFAEHAGRQTIPDGEYDVRFSTILQMLIGAPDGAWAGFAPLRVQVSTSAHGRS